MKKLYLQFVLFSALFIRSQIIQAQIAPSKQWDQRFGGINNELAYSVKQTADGGYVIAGYSESGIGGDKSQPNFASQNNPFTYDYWLVKTDSIGNKIWDRTFGGDQNDLLYSMEITFDGSFLLGGCSGSGISGNKTQPKNKGDFWIVKVDTNGNKLWDRTIGGSEVDVLNDMKQTKDGGYILGGTSWSTTSGDRTQPSKGLSDGWVVKVDANGNKVWDRAFGGSDKEIIVSIGETTDGGYILGGLSQSDISLDKSQNCFGDYDYWVIKIDALGNKQWDKTFGGDQADHLGVVRQTNDGGFIIGGTSMSGVSGNKTSPAKGGQDFWVIKLDAFGNKQWEKSLGGSGHEPLGSLVQTKDGGFILAGSSSSEIEGDKSQALYDTTSVAKYDVWIIKIDAFGNKVWDKSFGGKAIDLCNSIAVTRDGGLILGGGTDSRDGFDVSQLSRGKRDYWMLKLALEDVEPTIANTNGVSLYPNPVHETITVEVNNQFIHQVSVYNALGKLVLAKTVVTGKPSSKLQLDLSKEAKGIYIIHIVTEGQTVIKKVVLR